MQSSRILKNERQFNNINLSNQKGQPPSKKPAFGKPHHNASQKAKDRQASGLKVKGQPAKPQKQYQSTQVASKHAAQKNEDSLMRELGDVMSSSSYSEHCSTPMSRADPDLQQQPSLPEDSSHFSDMNKTKTTNKSIQSNQQQEEYINEMFRGHEETKEKARKSKQPRPQEAQKQQV